MTNPRPAPAEGARLVTVVCRDRELAVRLGAKPAKLALGCGRLDFPVWEIGPDMAVVVPGGGHLRWEYVP